MERAAEGRTGSTVEHAATRSVEVAIVDPSGALNTLSYAVPDHLSSAIAHGAAVSVPLGARRVTGIVLGPATPAPSLRLRPIAALLPEMGVPEELLRLVLWAARYYRAPLGSLVRTVIPPQVRQRRRRHVRPAREAGAGAPRDVDDAAQEAGAGATPAALVPDREPDDAPRRPGAPSAAGTARASNASPAGLGARILARLPAQGLDLERLEEEFGSGTAAALRALRRRGLVVVEEVDVERRAPHRALRCVTVAAEPDFGRARRQAEVYAFLRERTPHAVLRAEIEARFPGSARLVAALVARGLVSEGGGEPAADAPGRDGDAVSPDARPGDARSQRMASPAQADALAAIRDARDAFVPFLLFGVTGSGKTEVYLRAAQEARSRGAGVLILVPEIGLTPQLVAEAARRFPGETAVLHSGLPGPERWQAWRDVAAGRASVVIGARSAIFAPVPRLGLVVVDEEHDAAYKQEESPRYNARDLAVMRGKLAGCPVVLASATPSLESYRAAGEGRYRLLRLPARVNEAELPHVELVDLRTQSSPASSDRTGRRGPEGAARAFAASPLSPVLEEALVENYRAGDQSLLFLNRRGYARFIQCETCGHVETCPSCSVSLTVHRARRIAACHHCGFSRRPATHCPSCTSALSERGFGTEQIESCVHELLPAARIARLDRDTATAAGHLRHTVDAWRHGELDVLVGTQMVAKGHDAPGVTLIGVVLADASLHFPDFRAAERTFQLLAQVAGRAGRGVKPGRVLVQTRQPEHPSLVAATRHDFEAFAAAELAARRELAYPPFGRLARLVVEGERGAVERRAAELARRLQAAGERMHAERRPQVLGPAPAPIERLRGRDRIQLLVKAVDHRALAEVLDRARVAGEASAPRASRPAARRDEPELRVVVDVDPLSML